MTMKERPFYTMTNQNGEKTPKLVSGFVERIGNLWFGYYKREREWVSVELTTGLSAACGYEKMFKVRNYRVDLSKWNAEHEQTIQNLISKPHNQAYKDLILQAYQCSKINPPFQPE